MTKPEVILSPFCCSGTQLAFFLVNAEAKAEAVKNKQVKLKV
jgi:hypothetical protein